MSNRGFTFIELLTVMGIFAVIGTLAVSIVSLTLRGTKKSELFGIMRDNGNLALSQITRNIRYAKSLDSPTSCFPSVTVQSVSITSLYGGEKTEYACSDTTISADGESLIDANTVVMTECSFVCSQRTVNDPPTITLEFSLMPRNVTEFVESRDNVTFQSTVTMRNYNNR